MLMMVFMSFMKKEERTARRIGKEIFLLRIVIKDDGNLSDQRNFRRLPVGCDTETPSDKADSKDEDCF